MTKSKKNTSTSDGWKPHDSWGGLVMVVGTEISKDGKRKLAKAGLGYMSYRRIGILSLLLDGPQTQAALSRLLRQSPPAVMEMMIRLEADGLVAGIQDEFDGRKINWELTEKGKKNITKARDILRSNGQKMDAFFRSHKISVKEIERSKEILKIMWEKFFHH